MWENAKLTNAEYRARRAYLMERLDEDVRNCRELDELDKAFRKQQQAIEDRNNAIRERLGLPPTRGASRVNGRIRYALTPKRKANIQYSLQNQI